MGKGSPRQWSKWFHRVVPVVALVVFAIAITFLYREFEKHTFAEILGSIRAIPTADLSLAVVLTALSYLVLTLYDYMGFRYVGVNLHPRKILFTAFTAYAFSNNIGLSSLAGSSLRLRLYSGFGLSAGKIVRVIAFVTVTFWVGFLSIAGFAMLASPLRLPDKYAMSASLSTTIGMVSLTLAAGYVLTCQFFHRPIAYHGQRLLLPHPGIAFSQAMTAAIDWLIAAGVLYFLLPHGEIGYFAFLSIYVSAQIVALVSNVPGGVGVLEALVVYFLSATHEATPEILGGLLAYRMIYYIAPLILASGLYASHELGRRSVSRIDIQNT